ncbi:MAG: 50S ribosomal protein L4 [Candidatus Auribacterota bacterium]|nr:50S ribosomal protein L4 [Candidatus Auribacterota bacterium]
MTAIKVINKSGKEIEDVEFPDELLEVAGSTGIIGDVVRMHEGRMRRGTASAKNRSQVVASGRKPWRQKGTGRARAGSSSSPIWRGGGVIFGPQPRSFEISLPKKVKRKALRSILSIRFQKGRVQVIDELEMAKPGTKELSGILSAIGAGKSVLIITARRDKNIALSVRNIPKVATAGIRGLNTYLVAGHANILITREALGHLQAWMEKIS